MSRPPPSRSTPPAAPSVAPMLPVVLVLLPVVLLVGYLSCPAGRRACYRLHFLAVQQQPWPRLACPFSPSGWRRFELPWDIHLRGVPLPYKTRTALHIHHVGP